MKGEDDETEPKVEKMDVEEPEKKEKAKKDDEEVSF